MEDTLRASYFSRLHQLEGVLILVVMEDTLRVGESNLTRLVVISLNPCCNGRYSQSAEKRQRSNCRGS